MTRRDPRRVQGLRIVAAFMFQRIEPRGDHQGWRQAGQVLRLGWGGAGAVGMSGGRQGEFEKGHGGG